MCSRKYLRKGKNNETLYPLELQILSHFEKEKNKTENKAK